MSEGYNEKTERQIKILIDLIFTRGLAHSLEVAKKLEDPFILAEFHKTLIEKIYEELIKRKKLKKI